MLDLACGRGRHALYLARAGFRVRAVDRDAGAIADLRDTAGRLGLDVTCDVLDLETTPPPGLGDACYDAVVVFHYLHRPLFPAIGRALVRGGLLVYETFTVAQSLRGHPRNPAFLLHPARLAGQSHGGGRRAAGVGCHGPGRGALGGIDRQPGGHRAA